MKTRKPSRRTRNQALRSLFGSAWNTPARTLNRRALRLEQLEDRRVLAYVADLTGNVVTFTGDGASETLTLSTNAGNLSHNLPVDAGGCIAAATFPCFESSTDLNSAVAGVQALAVTSVQQLYVDAGAGNDVIQLNGLNLNTATSVRLDGEGDADTVSFVTAAVTVSGVLDVRAETIDQTAALTVVNSAAFTAGAGTVNLTNAANNFSATTGVSVRSSSTANLDSNTNLRIGFINSTGSVDLDAAGAVAFTGQTFTIPAAGIVVAEISASNIGGNLDIDANANGGTGGTITDTDATELVIAGTTTLDSGDQPIALNSAANQLGDVIVTTSTANQTLVDTDGFTALNINAGTTATVDLTIGDQITDADLATDITAANLVLRVDGGIGTGIAAGVAIQTDVDQLDVSNQNGGNIFILNTGALTLANLSATPNANAVFDDTLGASEIRATSPVTFAANAITAGGATYTALDSNAAGDNMTVNSGITVEDTTAGLTFNAGDNFDAQGTASLIAATSITINVDTFDADAPDVGSILTINNAATVTTTTGAFLNGGDDPDTFNFRPRNTTTFAVDGNAPTIPTTPGDILNLDLNTITSPALELTPTNSGGFGGMTFGNALGVSFREIETFDVTAGGPIAVDVRNDLSTDANVGAGNGFLSSGPSGIVNDIRLGTGGVLQINAEETGQPLINQLSIPQTDVLHLTLTGSAEVETFVITETAAGLPNFAAANPNGHLNPTFTTRTGAVANPSIHLEGNGGADLFRLDLSAAGAVRHVVYTTDTNATNSGLVQVANATGLALTRVSFDELAPADIVGPGAQGGDLLVDASSTPATALLEISDDTVANATAQFGAAVAGASFIDGDGGFEDVRFRGFNRLIVVGGGGAAGETIDLIGLDPATSLTNIILDGDDATNTDANNDVLRIRTLPAAVTATLLGGQGNDLFLLDNTAGPLNGITAGIAGLVLVSTNVAALAGSALPTGLTEEGGADVLFVDDGAGGAGRTAVLDADGTSATIEGMTGFGGTPDIRYNFPVSALNPAPNLIETINIDFGTAADTANVRATTSGSVYYLDLGTGAISDTVNISSDAGTNDGILDNIDGQVNIAMRDGADTINVSDFGDTAGDTYTLREVGGITELLFADGDAAVDVRYNVVNNNPDTLAGGVAATTHDVETFLLEGANALAATNTYNIQATTATVSNTVNDGDATITGVGNNAVFTITGDNLSAANFFRGFDGNDDFTLNITGDIGDNDVPGGDIVGVTIEGNANIPAFSSANRDRLFINDNLGANSLRNLIYDYQDTQGDLDIEAGAPNAGLFGNNGGGSLPLFVRTMETLRFNGDGANDDVVTVQGTSFDDDITVALSSGFGNGVSAASSAFVFLDGNPYITAPGAIAPPDSLDGNFPGVAGGGAGVDMLINGIAPATGITLDGSGTDVIGNRAIVQAISEGDLTDPVAQGAAVDIFALGLGAGVLVPGIGAGAAYDLISVNNDAPVGAGGAIDADIEPAGFVGAANRVIVDNLVMDQLVPVTVVAPSFVNGADPASRAGLIVNGGDEAAARGALFAEEGVADNFFVEAHPLFNIGINGNLPPLGPIAPDGFPAGDQLNLISAGSFSIWSDKETPPNVNILPGNGPFGFINSSIERTRLFPGNGTVNLIGDNNDPDVDQTDNFVVVGLDIDPGGSQDGGVQEMAVFINGSAPILIDGVQRLNTYGFDLRGGTAGTPIQDLNNPDPNAPDNPVTGATADDIDTLELTPFADNAGGPGNNAPRGWGVQVVYNEGSPPQSDDLQEDLLILHTSIGVNNGIDFFGGGIVSEDIVVQPSGPDDGEVRVTNAVDGSVIVVISYINNTDLIVVDDDGSESDTDTLTLRGTNPDTVQTSGHEAFAVDFDAAGTPAAPFVTVTDSESGDILYRLRSFSDSGILALDDATLQGGAGYVNGVYLNVPLTGGSGSGATANITVAGNQVTTVVLVNNGSGYTAGDVLSASNANLGGAGANFSIEVDTLAEGPIAAVTFDMLAGNDTLTFSPPNGAVGDDPQFGSGVEQVNVLGGQGDDSVTVDYGANLSHIWHNGRLFYDGGQGSDSLTFTGDAFDSDITTVTYTPGPLPGDGRIEHADGTDPAQVVDFVNLEPVVDLTVATALIVNGTNDADEINYTQGAVAANGLISINDHETIEFSNKATLVINARAGDDQIHLNNPNTPTGLIGDADGNAGNGVQPIRVNGGDPTASDNVIVNGTAAANTVVYTPVDVDTSIVVITGLPAVLIDTTEKVTYNGQGGGDSLTINGTALDDTFTINPANGGTGSHASNAAPAFNYISATTVTVDDATAVDFDLVVVNGTAGPDVFTTAAASLTLAGGGTVNFGDEIERLDLHLLAGNDTATLTSLAALSPTAPHAATNVFGGLGDDTIIGTGLVDLIYGGEGNDILIGGAGGDILFGEAGNDRFGDLANGNANVPADDGGSDQFHGGDGSDTFVWDPGDGSDLIEGGDGASDVLIFNGGGAVDNFTLSAVGTRLSAFRTQGGITLDTADVEVVNLNGLAGADTFTVNDLYPTAVEVVNIDLGVEAGVADTVTINGRDVSDNVNISDVGGIVEVSGLRYDVNVANAVGTDQDAFTFNANGGNDVVVTADDLSARFLSTNVAGTNRFTIDGGSGDDFLTSYGRLIGGLGNDTLIGSTTLANVNANQLIEGGAGDDTIRGGNGIDFVFGNAGEDTIYADFDSATDEINGGADFDTIVLQTTSGNDRIDFLQTLATQIQFNVAGQPAGATGVIPGVGTQTDTLVAQTVEEFEILAGSGDDHIRVAHAHALIAGGIEEDVLRITVDGGAPGASDRLSVTDLGFGNTTVHRVGGTPGEGSYQMYAFDGAVVGNPIVGMPPVVYTGIEFASLNPIDPITGGTGDGNGRLFVFKHDPHEENNSRLNATHLGANDAINVDPVIDPGPYAEFNLPGDEDWYRVVAETTGILDFTVYFRQQGNLPNGQAGLPGAGDLQLNAYDAQGELIPVIPAVQNFGDNETGIATDVDERIRIPVVAGQTYYFRVSGEGAAINVYNLTVLNEAPPVPTDLELDDAIVEGAVSAAGTPTSFNSNLEVLFPGQFPNDFFNGKVVSFDFGLAPPAGISGEEALILDYDGATGIFTLDPSTPLSAAPKAGDTFQIESFDTGRNSTDNTTRDNTPRLFFRLDDAIFLHDLPGNPVDDSPPDEVIRIPFNASQTQDGLGAGGAGAGFRIAIFDEGQPTQPGQLPQQPIGYARQVAEGVYVFDFGIDAINPLAPNGATTSLPLADGSHFLSARVQIIDPNTNLDTVLDDVVLPIDLTTVGIQSPKGFGDRSASLEIVVDTEEPPVAFGDPGLDGDGLTPDSDSFVIPNPHTIGDLVTNDLTPTFWGRGEANATIRLFADSYVDANANGIFDAGDTPPDGNFDLNTDVFIGQFTSIPIDGNQQEPNGFWQIESVVNFNDPRFFDVPDGSRLVFVTAEDVAGNVNDNADPAELEIFIDTQGPQVTGVTINQPDLFALAPANVLLTVSTSNPTLISSTIAVTGLGGRTLQAIDVLPGAVGGFAAGTLFGLATNGAGASIVTINPDNGVATILPIAAFGNAAATGWGLDFNPTSLLLRVTNDLDQNFSVNLVANTATLQVALAAAGSEDIVGSAYDRNDTDPTSPTTLFGIDHVTNFLVRQGDVNGAPGTPAGGVITPIGALGVNPDAQTGFDIAPGSNVAFASINDSLYTINLATGAATLVGKIGGPAQQILGIAVAEAYDLFDPKPSTDGPTPVVNSLLISFQDLPERTAAFLEEALKLDVADTPGLYQVRGDYNGIIPILAINVANQPVIEGEPAFATVELVFRLAGPDNIFNTVDDIGSPLPDDRFTLTILDNVQDLAGNLLDGEHNAVEPQETLVFPTGDGIPGGNFVARFTVDSRPEVGIWAAGSAWIDTNGNTSFDPTNADATNRDITYVLGFASDHLFAGKFMTPNDPNSPNARFDRLGAYGRLGTQNYRWLIDTDNDGVPDREVFDPANVNGYPVAGNFNLGFAGDEVGLYAGDTWHFDALGNNDLRVDTQISWPEVGQPIVGDFDGDGLDDLATWRDDTFYIDLSSERVAGPVGPLPGNGNINGRIDREFRFGFIGVGEKPVAADMNADGIEDIGLWVPAREGVPPTEGAEWYFLISGAVQNDTPGGGADIHGPSITGGTYPSNGHNGPGAHLAVGAYALQGLVADSYEFGRIVDDPLVAGVNDIVRFNPTPFGKDQYFQFGDGLALPIVGNFDPPVAGSPGLGGTASNPRNPFDVDNNGEVTAADALAIIDHLNFYGSTVVPQNSFLGAPFLDIDNSGVITAADALMVIDQLNLMGEGEGEGEAADAYFSELGSEQGEGEEDELLNLLANG